MVGLGLWLALAGQGQAGGQNGHLPLLVRLASVAASLRRVVSLLRLGSLEGETFRRAASALAILSLWHARAEPLSTAKCVSPLVASEKSPLQRCR